uniref:Chromosome 8 open reading frame 82 n=1 Tax=Cyprinus carpio TaxID=7962 RepID=A0A8C2HYK0_CYPCA
MCPHTHKDRTQRRGSESISTVSIVRDKYITEKMHIMLFTVCHSLKIVIYFSLVKLFLDDTKVKNFVTCFKDQHLLVFFFNRLKVNRSGRYEQDCPFLSLCGRERNFLRCEDRPVVFTHLLSEAGHEERLSYCGGGAKLTAPFCPESLFMHPVSGRVYHPGPERGGGVGLVRSALSIELSVHFEYAAGQESTAHSFHMGGASTHSDQ